MRRQAQDSLLTMLLENTPLAVLAWTPELRLTLWSGQAEQLFGWRAEEVIGRDITELAAIHPEDTAKVAKVIAELRDGRRTSSFSCNRNFRKDGTLIHCEWYNTARMDRDGQPLWFISLVLDVTERKRVEDERDRLAEQRKLALDAAQMGWWHYDSAQRLLHWDQRFADLFDLGAGPMPAREVLEKIAPGERTAVRERFESAMNPLHPAPYTAEFRLRTADGEVRWVEANGIASFEGVGESRRAVSLVGTVQEITARKLSEEALQNSESKFSTLFHRAVLPASLARLPELSLVDVNDAWLELLGYTKQEVIGRSSAELGIGRDFAMRARLIERLEKGETLCDVEQTVYRKDGRPLTVLTNVNTVLLEGRRHALTSIHDITDRKQAEARLRRFYETDLFAILYWRIDGAVLDANDRFLEMTGYTREELKAGTMNWAQMTPEEYGPADEDARRQIRETGVHRPFEKEFIRKDGHRVWGLFAGAAWEGSTTEGVSFIVDITARKQTEAALLRSEKLASVGRMAMSIAHEINNPLASVTNLLYLARLNDELPAETRQYLDAAEAELKRVVHITRQSLGFYRESTAPEAVSIAEVLNSSIDLLASKVRGKQASIRREWQDDLRALAVGGELRQVFSNLLANALDAIEQGGTIRLRISRTRRDTQQAVRATVCDDGRGIPRQAVAHIFEPFFTTKGQTGTGLGLWICRQILEKHRGSIRVRSSQHAGHSGTVVSVTLPLAEPLAPEEPVGN